MVENGDRSSCIPIVKYTPVDLSNSGGYLFVGEKENGHGMER